VSGCDAMVNDFMGKCKRKGTMMPLRVVMVLVFVVILLVVFIMIMNKFGFYALGDGLASMEERAGSFFDFLPGG